MYIFTTSKVLISNVETKRPFQLVAERQSMALLNAVQEE